MDSKRALRETYRSLLRRSRAGQKPSETSDLNHVLNNALTALMRKLIADSNAGYWAAFHAIDYEPDVSETCTRVSGCQWVYPLVEGHDLKFYKPSRPDAFRMGEYGIREPDPTLSTAVTIDEIRGFLVPGLVFDSKCNRLGRGKGYYDRALAHRAFNTTQTTQIKIGIAYDQQISPVEIPVEATDVPMDWVVTETRILSREGNLSSKTDFSDAFVPERNDS